MHKAPLSFPNLKFYSCTYLDENQFQTYYGRMYNYLDLDIFDSASQIGTSESSTKSIVDSFSYPLDHGSVGNLARSMADFWGI